MGARTASSPVGRPPAALFLLRHLSGAFPHWVCLGNRPGPAICTRRETDDRETQKTVQEVRNREAPMLTGRCTARRGEPTPVHERGSRAAAVRFVTPVQALPRSLSSYCCTIPSPSKTA